MQISSNKFGEIERDKGETCIVRLGGEIAEVPKTDLIHKGLIRELESKNGSTN